MKLNNDSIVVGVLFLLLAVTGCRYGFPSGPVHTFTLESAPAFLTEDLATAKAREALALDGFNTNEWELTTFSAPTFKAPDGTPDKYFRRYTFDPNAGRMGFRNPKGHSTQTQMRDYDVELKGNIVSCSERGGI